MLIGEDVLMRALAWTDTWMSVWLMRSPSWVLLSCQEAAAIKELQWEHCHFLTGVSGNMKMCERCSSQMLKGIKVCIAQTCIGKVIVSLWAKGKSHTTTIVWSSELNLNLTWSLRCLVQFNRGCVCLFGLIYLSWSVDLWCRPNSNTVWHCTFKNKTTEFWSVFR